MSIVINIYYTGKNGAAGKFAEEIREKSTHSGAFFAVEGDRRRWRKKELYRLTERLKNIFILV